MLDNYRNQQQHQNNSNFNSISDYSTMSDNNNHKGDDFESNRKMFLFFLLKYHFITIKKIGEMMMKMKLIADLIRLRTSFVVSYTSSLPTPLL